MGILRLPDGRDMEWREYGTPDGTPAFYLHGGASSFLEAAIYDAEAVAAGVRLIVPNRPGVGGSTPLPGFSHRTIADDTVRLADHLRIERFPVAGLSNGGMFALAVGAWHPSRVSRVVPVNSTTPLYCDAVAWEHATQRAQTAYEGVRAALATMPAATFLEAIRAQRWTEVTDPAGAVPAAAEPHIVALFDRVRDPVSPEALTGELTLTLGAWDFDPNAVPSPVEFVTGADDVGTPYAAVWVGRLPDARLHVVPGGHIAVLDPSLRRRLMALLGSAATG